MLHAGNSLKQHMPVAPCQTVYSQSGNAFQACKHDSSLLATPASPMQCPSLSAALLLPLLLLLILPLHHVSAAAAAVISRVVSVVVAPVSIRLVLLVLLLQAVVAPVLLQVLGMLPLLFALLFALLTPQQAVGTLPVVAAAVALLPEPGSAWL